MHYTKAEILADLDPTRPETIQALIDSHRDAFGGSMMMADGDDDKKVADGAKPDEPADGDKDKDGKTGDEMLGAGGMKALQAERDARKKLETELQEFKTSQKNSQADQTKKLAEALGIKTEDAKPEDMVAELQKQIQDMKHDNLVYRIVTDPKHQITDKDDLELIAAAADEATMRKLAARFAKKKDDPESEKTSTRRFPRQDPNQGRGGSNEGRPTSVAQVMADRAAARDAKK